MVTQEVDLPLPPAVLLRRCAREPFVFALDGSDATSWGCGRALLGFDPFATLRIEASGDALVHRNGTTERWCGDPFDLLERFCGSCAPPPPHASFGGGVIAALSYDLRHWSARRPGRDRSDTLPAGRCLPVLHAAAYDWWLSYSYVQRRYQLASCAAPQGRLRQVAARLRRLAEKPAPALAGAGCGRLVSDFTPEQYRAAVAAVLAYIAAGDVYQVNLAQRFTLPSLPQRAGLSLAATAAALYGRLQAGHPAPFGAYVDGGDFMLVSNSPECFLRRRAHTLSTFPIKGTRQRGASPAADEAAVCALRADPKEQAEHVMIVDLERNDLGRVCRTGSVRVDELARVHTFPSLHHMISQISGEVPRDTPLADILRATFPGGSVTGAPKIRAMEIIDELEPVRRDFYTGAIGVIEWNGDAVLNLAIRTAIATPDGLAYHAGGGVVADSVAALEYAESLLKAQPFFTALGAVAA